MLDSSGQFNGYYKGSIEFLMIEKADKKVSGMNLVHSSDL